MTRLLQMTLFSTETAFVNDIISCPPTSPLHATRAGLGQNVSSAMAYHNIAKASN
jgi:hypothetical protein